MNRKAFQVSVFQEKTAIYERRTIKAMHQPKDSHSAMEKWQLGMDRLNRAKAEPELLGPAMLSLHGALEDHFRHTLASLPQLPVTERFRVRNVRQVQWRELCDLMQKYLGLSDRDAKYILRMNSLRIDAGHGAEFRGSFQDVAAYADFIKGWLGTSETTIVPVGDSLPPNHSFIDRCPCCQSLRIKRLEVIYRQGMSVIDHGRGRVQVRTSGLSLQAAPPEKKKYLPAIGPKGGLLLVFLWPFVGAFAILVVPFWFYHVWHYNHNEYPRRLKEWRRTFQCEQCGEMFVQNTI